MKKEGRTLAGSVGVVLFWIAVWQGLSLCIANPILLASPLDTLKKLAELVKTDVFWQSVANSAGRISLGFLLALVSATLFAALSARSAVFRRLFSPLASVMKAVPVASFIILALIWVKADQLSTLISFLMVFPILYINTLNGIQAVPEPMRETARIYRIHPLRRVTYVYFPFIRPHFLSGCTVALGLCWKAGVAAEVIGQCYRSLGEQLFLAKLYLDTAEVFAYTLVIVAVSVAFEKLFLVFLRVLWEGLCREGKRSLEVV